LNRLFDSLLKLFLALSDWTPSKSFSQACVVSTIAARMLSTTARSGRTDSFGNLGGTRCPLTPMRKRMRGAAGIRSALTISAFGRHRLAV
jgi:hypothetical protein